jgi:CheY-like chemotaxis protein
MVRSMLLADDDVIYARLLQTAIARVAPAAPFFHVEDGGEAIRFLSGHGDFSDRARYPLPDVLLLDISMPHKNGLEVLEWIGTETSLAALPVIVISTIEDDATVRRAYELGAKAFLAKPKTFPGFRDLAEVLVNSMNSPRLREAALGLNTR